MWARLLAIASSDSSERVTAAPSRATRDHIVEAHGADAHNDGFVTHDRDSTSAFVGIRHVRPALHHVAHQWHAGPVGEVQVRRGVQPDEVRPPPGGEHADVVAAQRRRTARGGGPQRLGRSEIHVPHRHRDAERHAGGERTAGIAVGRQRDGHARVDEPSGRPDTVRAWRIRRPAAAWRRWCLRACERIDVVVGGIGAVVHRRRAQLDREPDARAGAELAGVQPRVEPGGRARREDVRASSTSKAPRSQNTSIHRACGAQAVSISPVTRSTYAVAVVAELGGNDVRAEERRSRR